MHTGSCLCRAVRFQVEGDLPALQICHCADCRRAQGSAFAANLPLAEAALTFLAGTEHLRAYESAPGKARVFCARCGAPVLSRHVARPGVVRLRAGTLDDPVSLQIGSHAFTTSSPSWWPFVEDGTPHYPGPRPA